MKYTNHSNLPQPLVTAVTQDPYSRGNADISVTQLISPPRKIALEAKHFDELEEDVSDRIWSLIGQSVHHILERANKTAIAERRLSMKVEDWIVSGAMDAVYSSGLLQDYKVTSVWQVINGLKEDWENQLNCYAALLRENGESVTKLQVVAILRDWSVNKAREGGNYPESQVVVIDVPLWPAHFASRWIKDRVILHQQARIILPECSSEDRWEKPTVYAVMKPDRKSAVRLLEDESSAKAMAAGIDKGFVVKRPGESTRCTSYCSVARFCTQWASIQKQGEGQ